MTVFPCRNSRIEELHVDLDAALLGVHVLVNDMFDQSVRRAFERHLVVFHDVYPSRIVLAKFLRALQRLSKIANVGIAAVGA